MARPHRVRGCSSFAALNDDFSVDGNHDATPLIIPPSSPNRDHDDTTTATALLRRRPRVLVRDLDLRSGELLLVVGPSGVGESGLPPGDAEEESVVLPATAWSPRRVHLVLGGTMRERLTWPGAREEEDDDDDRWLALLEWTRPRGAAKVIPREDSTRRRRTGTASCPRANGRDWPFGRPLRPLLRESTATPPPRPMILDEATSSLDPEAEARLHQRLRDSCDERGATTYVSVGHRFSPRRYHKQVLRLMVSGEYSVEDVDPNEERVRDYIYDSREI